MAIIEPLGMRLFGVEIRETQLYAISTALKETFLEYPPGWHEPSSTIEEIADKIIKFGDLVIADERHLFDSDPKILRELLSKSGLERYKKFLKPSWTK